ncbi:MAG: hypothetical protein WBQ60_00340 [Asticcacaulis sp.]
MAMPRILPLVAVAAAGVLAMKAITSLDLVPGAFQAAEAMAADVKKAVAKPEPKKTGPKGEVSKSDDPTESYNADPVLLAANTAKGGETSQPLTPICATSVDQLAKQAGISPNELNILQSLGKRRTELDEREKQINARAQLIEATDAKLDARITQLSDLKNQIQALLDQATKVQDEDSNRLVAVYTAMKPKDAAAVFATMSDDVRLPIAAKMKDRALAAILGAMQPAEARDLTEKLAKRMQRTDGLQQQLNKATTGGAAQAGSASAAVKPTPAKA